MAIAEVFTREYVEWLATGTLDGPILLDELIHRPQWQAWAACRDEPTPLFFVGRGEDTGPAKAVCARCPVRAECLDYALADAELVGTWAGTSGRERGRMRVDGLRLASS